jgi:hypothetical protein
MSGEASLLKRRLINAIVLKTIPIGDLTKIGACIIMNLPSQSDKNDKT